MITKGKKTMLYKFYFLVNNEFEGTIVSGCTDKEVMRNYLERYYEAPVLMIHACQI